MNKCNKCRYSFPKFIFWCELCKDYSKFKTKVNNMKKKMKKKCIICNTIFEFKIKDLRPIKNETNKYIINCTYCYSEKRIFYNPNPKPKKILNDVLNTESNIISLNILQDSLNKEGLIRTANLIKDFNNKYSKYIDVNKRMSKNEMVLNLETIKHIEKHDLIDKITSKSIAKQLVQPNFKYNKLNKNIIGLIIGLFMSISILFIIIISKYLV